MCKYGYVNIFLQLEKRRKRLKLKLEMAKFLQDTIEETALQRTNASGDSVYEFVKFTEKVIYLLLHLYPVFLTV